MKNSIKRKIKNAMLLSHFMTMFVLLLLMIPLLFFLIYPSSYFITKSMEDDIINRYQDTASIVNRTQVKAFAYREQSVESLITTLENQRAEHLVTDDEGELIDLNSRHRIVIKNENDIKRLMIISRNAYDQLNDFFNDYSVVENMGNIDLELYNYHLNLDNGGQASIEMINRMVKKNTRIIDIINEKGDLIGKITLTTDAWLIQGLVVILIILIGITVLISMILVHFLSRNRSRGIVKPIDEVNKQLFKLAENDLDSLECYQIDIKSPPKEISKLIQYSNEIYQNMADNKQVLENQNMELQAQNEDLIEKQTIIDEQNKQLIQTEKMASIGQITAAIVHEINTPVGAIKSNAQLTDMVLKSVSNESDIEKIKHKLDQITPGNQMVLDASNRIADIIKSIKNFSRIDQSDFNEADIHEALRSVLVLTSNLWKSRVTIEEDFGQLPLIFCHASMLNQVFLNLIVNAIDAIEKTGTIRIKTRYEDDNAIISISDTGCGILPENLEKVFEQGYTSKPFGKGSGLGLAISQDIIKKHNGSLTVKSTLHEGTTFTIVIPNDKEVCKQA